MNRFTKEIRKRGIRIESDYDHMPHYIRGHFLSPGYIVLEAVEVLPEQACVVRVYNTIVEIIDLQRNGLLQFRYTD